MIDLATLKPTKQPLPPRVVLYGPLKIGKSTWGSQAPGAIFQPVEEGIDNIEVVALPVARTYTEVLDGITALYEQDHKFRTYVLDTLDWLEPVIWAQACQDHDKAGIEEFGYGKGYVEALDYWRTFLGGLDALRRTKGMNVVLLAHNEIKRYDNPETEPYDRHSIKLHKAANALVSEWADCVLFANYKVFTTKTDVGFKKTKTRALDSAERLLYTTEKPAYIAGNRYGLPDSLPMTWQAFEAALKAAGVPV